MLDISNSESLKKKGTPLLPSLAQTFSKSPSSFVEGVYPVYADHGNGSKIFFLRFERAANKPDSIKNSATLGFLFM